VITYFLLNDESRRYIAAGVDQVKMPFDWADSCCRVANLEVPELATAHDETRIRQYTAEGQFAVADIVFGNWCGRPTLLGLQDMMVLIKT
jgi:hypothetical protein